MSNRVNNMGAIRHSDSGNEPNEALHELTRHIETIKAQHSREIALWMEYGRQVRQWRDKIYSIFQQLSHEVNEKSTIQKELDRFRVLLIEKQDEIQALKSTLAKIREGTTIH